MEAYLAKSRSQRAMMCEQVGDHLGIAPAAVEKDFWLCWVLRELFRLDVGPHLVFKGGTSLSKCYDLIERFSEDLDLVVERGFLGFGDASSPEAASSGNERKRRSRASRKPAGGTSARRCFLPCAPGRAPNWERSLQRRWRWIRQNGPAGDLVSL